jgi:ligand-binding sensor domain-containing protein
LVLRLRIFFIGDKKESFMKRLFIPALVAACAVTAFPAAPDNTTQADSSSSGPVTHYHIYEAGGPVHAFAAQEDVIWCAMESTVVAIAVHGDKKTVYPMLGSMPSAAIVAIVADKEGRVWFGGPNGIAIKTGAKFTNITAKNGLSNIRVNAITAAGDGSVWVGTDSGANVMAHDAWRQFTVKDGLLSDRIQAICTDDKGIIWLGTDKGICSYNGSTWTGYTAQNGMSDNADTRALAYDRAKGVLWAAVGDKDVNSFDGQKWNTYMDTQSGILTIMVDSQSRIWFGTAHGILKFNGDDWLPDQAPFGVSIKQAFQMNSDEKGNLWFAMERGVIHLLNPYPF